MKRDFLFKLLFPKQYEEIKRLSDLLKLNDNPDFRLSAPDGMAFKDICVYLATNSEGSAINCQWVEIPTVGDKGVEG